MGLSKRKSSCESQYCVKQIEGNTPYLNTCSLPPGQIFLIKNSQFFLLSSANLIKFPCALVPPSLSFLYNSNTSILNPSRANLQLCPKCQFSKQKFPKQNNPHPFQAYITVHLFLLTTKWFCHKLYKTQDTKS